MKHKKQIEKYNGDLIELVNDIGNLHYETLSEFLLMLLDMNKAWIISKPFIK